MGGVSFRTWDLVSPPSSPVRLEVGEGCYMEAKVFTRKVKEKGSERRLWLKNGEHVRRDEDISMLYSSV